ncbi:ly6/PLAUR domain-containing protein 4 isoform X2 [Mesocricetus auratus]|uniref:Ly6/PLAUR domain-containing protein 4 isoform X2 n=1 Tax=Mesocricetus auratus TaxID=10036 RepID=A0ABM2WI60_MESAU|nr:ly6/PLAUR domain-containing protein 4 isoform X2 [Mesocricetus auratus]
MGLQDLRYLQLLCLLEAVSLLPRTTRGIVSFKGCTSALSYPPQISYLVSPPGVSVASYSHVCRTYLCNNMTNLEPFVRLKADELKHTVPSAKFCPTCVGRHDQECLPNFVTTQACPFTASSCYSSTLKFQAGNLNSTFLIMGCVRESHKLLADFQHIGSIRVTEVVNVLDKSEAVGAGHCSQGPPWIILLCTLLIFRA